ncbi:FtsX-like permease family protein [Enterococcus canis]|uniref:FtsX-like permease family protein n=1 Tax=Enterococcus canis TaxID=214095 RepID=UPI00082CA598|nr:ABC transporter permease [Enterococcus canis]
MLFRLALKNLRKQFRDYLVYFASLIFAVVIYYSFSALTYNQPLVHRANQNVRIEGALNLGSVLIILIILVFLWSANRFYTNKRINEIWIYRLFGMRKYRIALLFLRESLVIGVFALAIGLFLGVLLSKLFAMILIKAMFLQIDSLFFISWPSMRQTIIVFLILLVIVSLRGVMTIYRFDLDDLSRTKKGKERQTPFWLELFFGVAGPLLILCGYLIAHYFVEIVLQLSDRVSENFSLLTPLFILLLCVVGTYLFFHHTVFLLMRLVKEGRYYQHLRPLMIGNLRDYFTRNRSTLTFVTIFIGVALAMIGGTASLYTLGIKAVGEANPTDYLVGKEAYPELKAVLEEQKIPVTSEVSVTYKLTGALLEQHWSNVESDRFASTVNLLKLSDYEKLKAVVPNLQTLSLADDTGALFTYWQGAMGGKLHFDRQLVLAGNKKMKLAAIKSDSLGDDTVKYLSDTLVVTDATYQALQGHEYELHYLNATIKDENTTWNLLNKKIKADWVGELFMNYQISGDKLVGYLDDQSHQVGVESAQETTVSRLDFTARYPALRYARGQYGLLIFVAMFLGVMSLIATGSILLMRQYNDQNETKERYALLKKIGIPSQDILRVIYWQTGYIFFPPMLIGICHAGFALEVYSAVISSSGYWLVGLACGFLVLIYLLFYLITVRSYLNFLRTSK